MGEFSQFSGNPTILRGFLVILRESYSLRGLFQEYPISETPPFLSASDRNPTCNPRRLRRSCASKPARGLQRRVKHHTSTKATIYHDNDKEPSKQTKQTTRQASKHASKQARKANNKHDELKAQPVCEGRTDIPIKAGRKAAMCSMALKALPRVRLSVHTAAQLLHTVRPTTICRLCMHVLKECNHKNAATAIKS